MRGYVCSAEFVFVLGKGVERGVEVLLDGLVSPGLSCRSIVLLLTVLIGSRHPEYRPGEVTPRFGGSWRGRD
jgi:hypothetical protein